MALFYLGNRPVTKGRNSNDSVNPYTGKKAVYSNWSIYNTSHVLDGGPNQNHVPGTGSFPTGLALSRYFLGVDKNSAVEEMRNVGDGVRLAGFRYHPWENKAAGNNKVFKAGFGHIDRDTNYSQFDAYDDSERQRRLDNPGHVLRPIGTAGAANSFGYFNPYVYKGVTEQPLDDSHFTVATTYDGKYGRNRVIEWQGVNSAKALAV